jgi:pimeloyl-ACP methyl ester carboxylesterase
LPAFGGAPAPRHSADMVARCDEVLTVKSGRLENHLFVTRWTPDIASRGTVLCIHGFTCSRLDFAFLADRLCLLGLTVICPDMPGHGRSRLSGPVADLAPEGPTGLTNVAHCLSGLTGHYAPEPKSRYFLGTSWGAAMVLFFLAATKTPARRVILNDLMLEWHPALSGVSERLRRDSALSFATAEAAIEHLERRERELFRQDDAHRIEPAVLQRYLAARLAIGDRRVVFDSNPYRHPVVDPTRETYPDYYAIISAMPAEQVMLLFGANSPFCHSATRERLSQTRPNVQVAEIPDAGHAPRLLTPTEAALVARFFLAP